MARTSAPLRRLGAELRRLREAAERTQADVGEAVGRSYTTIVNWEGAKTRISKSDLAYLLAELRAPVEIRKGLEQLWEEARRSGSQWAVYNLPSWLRPLLSFEEDAAEVLKFEPVVIPGPLQVEEYARATHLAAPHIVPPADVDRWVAARMQRQRRLTEGPDRLRYHTVICEEVMTTEVSSPEVMAAQHARLLELAEEPNVTIQVLPKRSGKQVGVGSNFTVLHFPDPAVDPPLGYADGPLGGYMFDDQGDVASLETLFVDLSADALPEDESKEVITGIMDEVTRKEGNANG